MPGVQQVTPGCTHLGRSSRHDPGGGSRLRGTCLHVSCGILAPVPAWRRVEGSWELAGVVSAQFEQSLAKPSPRLILICVL